MTAPEGWNFADMRKNAGRTCRTGSPIGEEDRPSGIWGMDALPIGNAVPAATSRPTGRHPPTSRGIHARLRPLGFSTSVEPAGSGVPGYSCNHHRLTLRVSKDGTPPARTGKSP